MTPGRIIMLGLGGSHISFVEDLNHRFFQRACEFLYE